MLCMEVGTNSKNGTLDWVKQHPPDSLADDSNDDEDISRLDNNDEKMDATRKTNDFFKQKSSLNK